MEERKETCEACGCTFRIYEKADEENSFVEEENCWLCPDCQQRYEEFLLYG